MNVPTVSAMKKNKTAADKDQEKTSNDRGDD
jgi:hypothetical protein